ncbi:MAG: FG-GAP repeat protein [Planctomycetes bacterium]|nr:FG-GAP repeat protein [Planctomycetota bacterium]
MNHSTSSIRRRRVVVLALTLAVLSIVAITARAQSHAEILQTRLGFAANAEFGFSVAIIGDINHEGFDDYAVGTSFAAVGSVNQGGSVIFYNGSAGAEIYSFAGDSTSRRLGYSVAGGGDYNGDGHPDIVCGAWNGSQGQVKVYSGHNGLAYLTLGDAAGWGLGFSVADAGDTNGDGRDDFITGLPYYDTVSLTNAGQVRVWGLSGSSSILIASWTGNVANQRLGHAVDGMHGDVNFDGLPDIVAGAPYYNLGFPNATIGRVQVLSPALGSNSAPRVDFIPNIGSINPALCGYAVAGLGDINGDGRADFATGSPGFRVGNGSTTLDGRIEVVSGFHVTGQSATVLWTSTSSNSSSDRLGYTLAAMSDVTGDGILDLAAGAPTYGNSTSTPGSALVFSGAGSGTHYPIRRWIGPQHDMRFGHAVAAGDVNGDGFGDVLVGAKNFDNGGGGFLFAPDTGRVDIYSGRGFDRDHRNASGFAQAPGHRVGIVGDLNGDGFDEYAIARPDPNGNGGNHGTVSIRSGFNGGQVTNLQRAGTSPDEFGAAVTGVGDLNGDGVPEIVVGAPGIILNGFYGAAFVYDGATFNELATLQGSFGSRRFGHCIAAADINGDGVPDIIVGDPAQSGVNNLDFGKVTIFSGANFSVIGVVQGPGIYDELGTGVAGLPDITGDGFDEFAIGWGGHGVSNSNDGSGRVQILAGDPSGNFGVLFTLDGTSGEGLGTTLANAGDIDGNGSDDLLVGSPTYTSSGLLGGTVTERGRIRVISGTTFATIYTRNGDASGDHLGAAVSAAGDVDGDGRCDIIAGAPLGDSQLLTDNGYALVISGSDYRVLLRLEGAATTGLSNSSGTQLGRSVAGGARITSDHRSDFLCSSTYNNSPGTSFQTVISGLGDLVGLDHYGTGTPGCEGPISLTAFSPPRVGNQDFKLVCNRVEPATFGTLLATVNGFQIPGGFDPANIGLIFHANWGTAPFLSQTAMMSDVAGHAEVASPLPQVPTLAGFVVVLQAIWYSPAACAAGTFGYSSTNGLDLTIQP